MTSLETHFSEIVIGIPRESVITDPRRDRSLDVVRFRQGFDDAYSDLDGLPLPWARQRASQGLAGSDNDEDSSYCRGYRAGMYGFLRHSRVVRNTEWEC